MRTGQRNALVTLLLAAALAPNARAQTAVDPRWQPWLGCWMSALADTTTPATAMCVIPAAGVSAVDIVQIADLQVVARNHIDADGARHPGERNGCAGWDRAVWSPEGRLLLRSEHECPGGEHRVITAVMAVTPGDEWLTVQGASVAGRRSVLVQHYRGASGDLALPEEVALTLTNSSAGRRAPRLTEAPAVGTAEIIAANQQVEVFTLEAWLAEAAGPVRFSGRQLVHLADGGVEGSTVDVLVALTHRGLFAIAEPVEEHAAAGVPGPAGAFLPGLYVPGRSGYGGGPFMDSDSAMRCQAFNNMWQTSFVGYSYMAGACGTYANSWYYQRPQIDVQPLGASVVVGNGATPKGRAVNGSGYTRGASRAGTPPSGNTSTAGQTGSSTTEVGTASPGGYGAGSNTSTSTGRTAAPRPETGDRKP